VIEVNGVIFNFLASDYHFLNVLSVLRSRFSIDQLKFLSFDTISYSYVFGGLYIYLGPLYWDTLKWTGH